MSALSSNFVDCAVLIYDEAGNQLGSTIVTYYNKDALLIEVEELPPVIENDGRCKLLILSSPSPCEYQGRIVSEGAKKVIAIYHGVEKESRMAVRYKVNYPASIENLICVGKAYPLLTPLEVGLINISKSGMRFRAPNNSLAIGDMFQIRIKIGDNSKILIADVVNYSDKSSGTSEYGCRFLIGSD